MRYLTWNLHWPTIEYGTGPEQTVADNGARLEASSWVNPSVEHGSILGYFTGGVNLALLTDWNAVEVTEAQALAFAQAIDENAYVMDDGVIGTTTLFDVI